MSSITTPTFWKDTAERVVSTGAQTAIAVIAVSATVTTVNWEHTADVVGIAMILSILKAVVAGTVVGDDTASLVNTIPVATTTPEHDAESTPAPVTEIPETPAP